VTEEHVIDLLLRVFLISGFASIIVWVVLYTRWARWWENTVGRTIVIKDVLIAAVLVPTALALFLHLSRRDSLNVAWADVALIGLITPVMCWRIVVWARISRGKPPDDQQD